MTQPLTNKQLIQSDDPTELEIAMLNDAIKNVLPVEMHNTYRRLCFHYIKRLMKLEQVVSDRTAEQFAGEHITTNLTDIVDGFVASADAEANRLWGNR